MVQAKDVEYEGPDLYGQFHPIESPELIEQKLTEFHHEVTQLASNDKKALDMAQLQCPELLTSDFKLAFLRCEIFHAPNAALRWAKYWNKRYELLGNDAFQPLTINTCLGKDSDRVAREMGLFNLIPVQGRLAAFERIHKYNLQDTDRMSVLRVQFYLMHVALENEETQKKGMICFHYPRGVNLVKQQDLRMVRLMASFKGSVPLRLSAYHVCHPPSWASTFVPLVRKLLGRRLSQRIVFHTGSDQAVLRYLKDQFGFKASELPVEIGGDVTVDMIPFYREREKAGL